jgi:hypothetical protein
MSHQPLQRGPITKAVLAAARSTDFPAEVALIPKDGGWRDGAPAGDRSLFTPYTVVVPQTASFSTGALDYGQDDWHLPYAFNYYAIQNTQIEDFADLVRVAVAGIVGSVVPILSGPDYKIIKVAFPSVGGVVRVDQSEPPFYIQTDAVEVWVSRELS